MKVQEKSIEDEIHVDIELKISALFLIFVLMTKCEREAAWSLLGNIC